MVSHFIRDSFFGRLINQISGHKVFPYPEEQKDYVIPQKYLNEPVIKPVSDLDNEKYDKETAEKMAEGESNSGSTVEGSEEKDDHILVTFEENDPENPYNWPLYQRVIVMFEVALLTLSVYMGAAVYTPGAEDIQIKFGVNRTKAILPLSLFVIGYGIGPMVLSPITENASIGRTKVYIITLFIFFILQIPTALTNSFAGLCVCRVIAGFFASPALSTGGASVGDVIPFTHMPIGLAIWSIGGVLGPLASPIVGAVFMLIDKGSINAYRWTFWYMAIVSGFSTFFLGLFLPETYGKAILYRKAERLRKLTGNDKITSEGHLELASKTSRQILIETLWRPIQITTIEPVVLLINMHITLLYSVIYLWFEAFPIVFTEVHGFNSIELGATYFSVAAGVIFGAVCYVPYIYFKFTKPISQGAPFVPEVFLPGAIFGSCLIPTGIFIFAWTSSPDIHWFPPLVGSFIFSMGTLIIFQTEYNYLGASFYRYLASTFASNTLFRSVIAGCFPLFAHALFTNTRSEKFPVGWGASIIAFIGLGMIAIPVFFWMYGPQLRARSKFAN